MPEVRRGDVTIAYEVTGEGPPVLLIQGTGVPGEGWRPQIDALSARYRVAWFDHRGIGRSGAPVAAFSVDDLAEDAAAVLDACGWPATHLAGHSLGGIVAHRLARRHPGRALSLSLMCTFLCGRHAVGITPRVAWLGLRSRLGTRRMRRLAFLEMIVSPSERAGADVDALAAHFARYFQRDLADHPPVEMQQVAAMWADVEELPSGAISGVPTWVCSAEHDVLSPPQEGQALAARISGARFERFDGAGHGVPLSQPERFNAAFLAFLDGVGSAGR